MSVICAIISYAFCVSSTRTTGFENTRRANPHYQVQWQKSPHGIFSEFAHLLIRLPPLHLLIALQPVC